MGFGLDNARSRVRTYRLRRFVRRCYCVAEVEGRGHDDRRRPRAAAVAVVVVVPLPERRDARAPRGRHYWWWSASV